MWTIRREQVDTFRQAALRRFEDQMVEHLQQFAPEHWRVMGEPDGRKVIRMGIARASQYGFTNQGPVRFYIELMFMFGGYFDTDPQYPWAGAILKNVEPGDQMVRADQLHDAMNEYVEQVSGKEHEYMAEAMRQLSQARIEDILQSKYSENLSLEQIVLRELEKIYPRKCAYLGEPVLRALIQHGFGLAVQYDMASDKGMILMAALAFAAGHGFPADPQFAWIARRLEDKRPPDPKERTAELYSEAMISLNRLLSIGAK